MSGKVCFFFSILFLQSYSGSYESDPSLFKEKPSLWMVAAAAAVSLGECILTNQDAAPFNGVQDGLLVSRDLHLQESWCLMETVTSRNPSPSLPRPGSVYRSFSFQSGDSQPRYVDGDGGRVVGRMEALETMASMVHGQRHQGQAADRKDQSTV